MTSPHQRFIEWTLAALALFICWLGVSWAFVPGLCLWMDEIGNLTRFPHGVDLTAVSVLPKALYNDRPIGFAFERLLFDNFGFDYYRQLQVYILLHFANIGLGFALFRRLGVSTSAAAAAIACFGVLSTTSQTATYIGAVFDVACLFFLLSSILAFLATFRGARTLSVVMFVFALRTKEFAIVLPALVAMLAFNPWPASRHEFQKALRRVAPHAVVGAIFAACYLSFLPRVLASLGPTHPYRIDVRPSTIANSLNYYTSLIFGMEDRLSSFWPVTAGLLVVLVALAATAMRKGALPFALSSHVLTLLPVASLPGNRAPFYVYCPQLFLLLAIALCFERLASLLQERFRFYVASSVAVLVLFGAVHFRLGNSYRDRIHFLRSVREVSAITARDASALLVQTSGAGPLHFDIYSDGETPWLFIPGPCDNFHVLAPNRDITCAINPGPNQGGAVRSIDLRYRGDGSVRVTAER